MALACGVASLARADDKDTIEYRQHIMKSLDAQSAILGQIVSGGMLPLLKVSP